MAMMFSHATARAVAEAKVSLASERVEHAGRSIAGFKRSANQDSFTLAPDLGLFVVTDGMGAPAGGDFAASLAAREVLTFLHEPAARAPAGSSRLVAAVEHANRRVLATQGDSTWPAMGTTIAAALVRPGLVTIAHVGDSRVYRWCEGRLETLTHDHSVSAEMVRRGIIRPDKVRGGALDGMLSRCLGQADPLDVDVCTLETVPGDVVLLCSDGLWTAIEDEEIGAVLRQHNSAAEAADRLMGMVLDRHGADDATAVVLRWPA